MRHVRGLIIVLVSLGLGVRAGAAEETDPSDVPALQKHLSLNDYFSFGFWMADGGLTVAFCDTPTTGGRC